MSFSKVQRWFTLRMKGRDQLMLNNVHATVLGKLAIAAYEWPCLFLCGIRLCVLHCVSRNVPYFEF